MPRWILSAAVVFLLCASAFLAWQWVAGKGLGLRSPAGAAGHGPFIHNGIVGIWPSRVYEGIIDLYYYDPSFVDDEAGHWRQFNNVVPVAATRFFVNNAEMEHAGVEVEILESVDDSVVALLNYNRFRNGIQIQVLVTLRDSSIVMEVFPTEDSEKVRWLTLGTYAGFMTWTNEIHYAEGVLQADALPPPRDGYLKPGSWITIPSVSLGNEIQIRSTGPLVQTMQISADRGARDRLEVELRASPWLPALPRSEQSWFEAVQMVREPFSLERNRWVFTVDVPETSNRRPSDA